MPIFSINLFFWEKKGRDGDQRWCWNFDGEWLHELLNWDFIVYRLVTPEAIDMIGWICLVLGI